MPKVSIIVPVYNVESFLEKTIEALRCQTLTDMEIIFVDDGSGDQSGAICDRYALIDNRIHVLHEKNGGVSNARNIGIANAHGDYIGFCDSDDVPHPDLYETLYELCKKEDADLASVKSQIIYEDGSVHSNSINGGMIIFDKNEDALKALLQGKTGVGVYKYMLRSELAKNISFDTSLKINEDKKYVFDALCACKKFVHLDEVKYDYYRRRNSASCSKFNEKYFDGLKVSQYILDQVGQNYPDLNDYAVADRAVVSLWTLKLMIMEYGKKNFPGEWKREVAFLKQLRNDFCKKYFSRNTYIKWLALKIGEFPFSILVKMFCRN